MNFSCSICRLRFESSDEVSSTRCGHIFHLQCLSQWLEISKTCPDCRERTKSSHIHRLFFNLSNDNSTFDDSASSQERIIQTQQLQITSLEADVQKFKKESKNFEKQVTELIDLCRNWRNAFKRANQKIQEMEKRELYNQRKSHMDASEYKQREGLLKTQVDDLKGKLSKQSEEHQEYEKVIQRLEKENKKLKKAQELNVNKENRPPLSMLSNNENISINSISIKKPHPARDLTFSAEPRACNASDRLGGGSAKTEQLPKTTNAEVKEKPVLNLRTRTIPRD